LLIPKRSRVFEGDTLEKLLLGLEKGSSLLKLLIIVDAGIAVGDNLKWLRDNHQSCDLFQTEDEENPQ